MPSIRAYLLIHLLLSVMLITSLAIIGNLFLAHKDIQSQLDIQLVRTSQQINAFFSGELDAKNLALIQEHLQELAKPIPLSIQDNTHYEQATHDTLVFQIWDQNGKLVLHSPGAPNSPLSSGKPGLSTIWSDEHSWRVNTIHNENNKVSIMVAEQANYRQHLENKLTQDSIIIMLITYPLFLGLLIWIIVGRGLEPLKKISKEVRYRAPAYLEPVDLESVPAEIQPLISELNSLFNRLKEAFERHKRFTADAAHELKTPLAALSTQTQVALRADNVEERNQALLKVLAGVNRSTHVIQQLLTLSRMVPEAQLEQFTDVVLARQAAEVAMLLAPEAIAKNIDLELLAPESKAKIKGNPTAINILMRNLIDNAIRYSPEGSFVKIDIVEKEKSIVLHVIDNGPGIPEELKERVFERFFRILGNQSTGSGLGLGIVQQIAQLHHADIRLATPKVGGLDVQVTFLKIK